MICCVLALTCCTEVWWPCAFYPWPAEHTRGWWSVAFWPWPPTPQDGDMLHPFLDLLTKGWWSVAFCPWPAATQDGDLLNSVQNCCTTRWWFVAFCHWPTACTTGCWSVASCYDLLHHRMMILWILSMNCCPTWWISGAFCHWPAAPQDDDLYHPVLTCCITGWWYTASCFDLLHHMRLIYTILSRPGDMLHSILDLLHHRMVTLLHSVPDLLHCRIVIWCILYLTCCTKEWWSGASCPVLAWPAVLKNGDLVHPVLTWPAVLKNGDLVHPVLAWPSY